MRAALKRALRLAALALPLALLAGLGWTLDSEGGLRFLLARADAALARVGPPPGGGLRVAASRGSVLGGFELDGVELRLAKAEVRIERLRATPRALPLLLGRLALETLELEGLRVALPTEPDPTPFVLPERIDLPLHISVERYSIRDLGVAAGSTPLLALDAVEGRASADARGFRVEDARISGAGLSADGSLALANAQPYPIEGALRLKLEREGLPPTAGNLQLGGRLEALRVAVRLEAPLEVRAELALDDPFGAKRVSGRIRSDDADPSPLVPSLLGVRFDADLELSGSLAGPTLGGTLAAREPGLPELRATIASHLAGRLLVLDRMTLTADGLPTRVEAQGRARLDGPDLPFSLRASAADPAAPEVALALDGDLVRARGRLAARKGAGALDGELTVEPRAARAALDGTLVAWPLPAGLRLDAERLRASFAAGRATLEARGRATRAALVARYDLRAFGDARELALDSLELALLDGSLRGSGRLELAGERRLQAKLQLRDLDPRGLDARFPGRVDADLAIGGTARAPVLDVTGIGGELRGRKLAGHARLRRGRAPELVALGLPDVVLEQLELAAGGAQLDGHASATDAALRVDAPELADLLPSSRGSLSLRAQRAPDGALDAEVRGRGIALATARIATLDVDLDAPAQGVVSGGIKASGLSAGDLALDGISLSARGPRDDLVLGFEATGTGTAFGASAQGALGAAGFDGRLTRWELAPVDAARWTLAQPAALRIGRSGMHLAQACASDGAARACVDGGWHPLEPWRAELAVTRLGIGAFRNWLPRGLAYTGDIDLDAQIAGDGPTLGDARAELRLSSGGIETTVRRTGKDAKRAAPVSRLIEFSGGRVLLDRRPQALGAHALLELTDGGRIDAELEARGSGPIDGRPLSGKVVAKVEQFALLPVLLPEVKQLSGRLEADLAVGGSVGAPKFSGRAEFHGGAASVPRFGLDLAAIELTLEGDGEALELSGEARAGGTLGWRATLRRAADGWSAKGTLKGEGFRALDMPEARVTASPDLAFELAGERLNVTGSVAVPAARIAPRSLASAVQVSGDEVLVGEDVGAQPEGALSVEARVHVALGDDVRFDGFGLQARVAGGLTLIEKPGSLTLASGELALVDGKYEAYGQLLAIERGKLLFSGGPVADPGLDVRALRLIEGSGSDDIKVGIDVRGTLRRPETSLFSDPAMSSSEQLSYLVLGRSLSESTEGDQKLLGDAAQSMKLSGGELLAQQIGRRIGLDEVKIEDSGDQEDAQLWLGTYLSPRLFVSYGIGLFEDFYSARVRYDISTKWTLEAESGRESSADIKYTIER